MSAHAPSSEDVVMAQVVIGGQAFFVPTTRNGATAASNLVAQLGPSANQPEAPLPDLVKLLALAERITHLNPAVPSIGAGMLASLVDDARRALGQQGGADVPAPKSAPTFEQLPLASCSLSIEERAKWITVLDPLLKYAGRPGDWGRESKLGMLTMRLMQARAEIASGDAEGGAR